MLRHAQPSRATRPSRQPGAAPPHLPPRRRRSVRAAVAASQARGSHDGALQLGRRRLPAHRPRPVALTHLHHAVVGAVAASRLRNGTASNASGPSTPVPCHAPVASSSSATTGLTAVCHTTAWLPYSRIVSALSATWYRYTSRGWPSYGALHPRAGARAAVHQVAELRRVRQHRGEHVAGRHLDARRRGCAPWRRGRGRRTSSASSMKSAPRPYLNVTRLQSTQRGTSSTSSCSTLTHSIGPDASRGTRTSPAR